MALIIYSVGIIVYICVSEFIRSYKGETIGQFHETPSKFMIIVLWPAAIIGAIILGVLYIITVPVRAIGRRMGHGD